MKFRGVFEFVFHVLRCVVCRGVVFLGVLVWLACVSVGVWWSIRCVVVVICLCVYGGFFLCVCRAWGFVPICDEAVVAGVSVCSALGGLRIAVLFLCVSSL